MPQQQHRALRRAYCTHNANPTDSSSAFLVVPAARFSGGLPPGQVRDTTCRTCATPLPASSDNRSVTMRLRVSACHKNCWRDHPPNPQLRMSISWPPFSGCPAAARTPCLLPCAKSHPTSTPRLACTPICHERWALGGCALESPAAPT